MFNMITGFEPLDLMIANSNQNAEIVLNEARNWVMEGRTPASAYDIFDAAGVDPNDLTGNDLQAVFSAIYSIFD